MAFDDEPSSTIHQILQRLDALESQVAYMSQTLGVPYGGQAGGWPSGSQPGSSVQQGYQQQPVPGPVPGYGSPVPGGADPATAFPDVVALARAGKKIEAIKRYREYTNASLKVAKDFVDQL